MATKGALFDCTFKDVKTGAEIGCEFCAWFMDNEIISRESVIRHCPNDFPTSDPYWEVLDALQDSAMWIQKFLGDPQPHSALQNIDLEQSSKLDHHRLFASTYQSTGNALDIVSIEFFGLWNPETRKIDCRTRHGFEVFTQPDDPAAHRVSTRPIECDPGSNASLTKISSWLKDCQEAHTLCQDRSQIRPARLLEISNIDSRNSLRLLNTQQLGPVPFAALSYCWGSDQPFKCLDEVLSKFMKDIVFSDLPTTIRDAVTVCQRLGIGYLWVDVLCIIQDNEDDKTSEIAKMPYIYGNAIFTIAAARSRSVHDGFLLHRVVDPGAVAFRLPYRCHDNLVGSITLLKIQVSSQPIDERCWTLQERLLSKRTIEFGSRQTRWFCQEVGTTQDHTDGWRARPEYFPLRKDTLDIWKFQKMTDFHPARDYGSVIRHWNRVVEAYTQRRLSLPTDRAQAISGIAEVFGQLLPNQYKAGLWRSSMHAGLLWKISDDQRQPRPTIYQGPSWSWTSVNGKVDFSIFDVNELRPMDCQAQIVGIDCSLVNDLAPYGAIREDSGQLRLRARTAIGARVVLTERKSHEGRFMIGFFGRNGAGVCIAQARMSSDAIEEDFHEDGANLKDDNSITALEIQSRIKGYRWHCRGLVLRQITAKDGWFRRVGTFEYRDGRQQNETAEAFETRFDWFRHQPYSTVVIV